MDMAYRTILRPKLEYAAAVWDPYTQANIAKIESVQRRAARFVSHNYSREASVTTMLTTLKWPSLQQRRAESRLSMAYRITHNKVDIRPDDIFPTQLTTRPTRNSHSLRYKRPQCSKDCYKFSFVPRTVTQWNNLPSAVVNSETLDDFKPKLSELDLTLSGQSYH